MSKKLCFLFVSLFAVVLFAEEDLEKKAMTIFGADMPKGSVNTLRLMKKTGKIYESFKEYKEKFTPSGEDAARSYGLFEVPCTEDIYPNYVPAKNSFKSVLSSSATPGERRIVALGVYPMEDIGNVLVSAGNLEGPGGKSIPAKNITVNAVKYDYEPEGISWFCKGKYAANTNEAVCLKEIPRLFYISVSVPEDASAGQYKGSISVSGGKKNSEMSFVLEVQPFKFEPLSDEYYFGAFNYYDFSSPDLQKLEKILMELKERGMNVMHGYFRAALKFTASGVEIDFTNIEKNALLLKKYGHKRWIIEMTGLPNEIVDAMGCKYYDERFNKAYKDMLVQIKERMTKGGWPEIQIMIDEPREQDTDNPRPLARTYWDLENLYPLHAAAGLPALPSYERDDGGPRFDDTTKRALYWEQGSKIPLIMTHGILLSEKLIKETLKNGNMVYLYNGGYGRYQFGLHVYQLNAKGHVQFWYFSVERLTTMAKFPVNYAVVLAKDGPYISTIRWLRSSEGVNDFRYIYTLSKKLEKLKDKSAPAAVSAQSYLDSIKSISFGKNSGNVREADTVDRDTLNSFSGAKLDEMRSKLTEHIIAVDRLEQQ
ncbi:MAG: glycoside hydrolase domain-containing protein [Candidatus Firestonebacteria bacterium]